MNNITVPMTKTSVSNVAKQYGLVLRPDGFFEGSSEGYREVNALDKTVTFVFFDEGVVL